jgi:hypothetical protein
MERIKKLLEFISTQLIYLAISYGIFFFLLSIGLKKDLLIFYLLTLLVGTVVVLYTALKIDIEEIENIKNKLGSILNGIPITGIVVMLIYYLADALGIVQALKGTLPERYKSIIEIVAVIYLLIINTSFMGLIGIRSEIKKLKKLEGYLPPEDIEASISYDTFLLFCIPFAILDDAIAYFAYKNDFLDKIQSAGDFLMVISLMTVIFVAELYLAHRFAKLFLAKMKQKN